MSKINGETARTAGQQRERNKQRVKDRASKAVAGEKKPGGRPMAARAARRAAR